MGLWLESLESGATRSLSSSQNAMEHPLDDRGTAPPARGWSEPDSAFRELERRQRFTKVAFLDAMDFETLAWRPREKLGGLLIVQYLL